MANKRIIELENKDTLTGAEYLAIDGADGTYKYLLREITNNYGVYDVTCNVDRWLRFDASNHKGLIIKKGTLLKKSDGTTYYADIDKPIDLSNQVSTAGAEYFLYLNDDDTFTASTSEQNSGVKIGRFHTLCADVGTITMIAPTEKTTASGKYLVKPYDSITDTDFYNFYNKDITAISTGDYYNIATMSHPLSGYTAGDILPESVFCLTFRPNSVYDDGMVYDKATDRMIDIYLQSGTSHSTRSAYNAVHTVSRQQPNHEYDMLCVGKELLSDDEFTSASMGSNQATNIIGSSDKSTVGGHVDTANRRMISAIGCEEMCGYLYQWLRDVSAMLQANGTSGEWTMYDGRGAFGQSYYKDSALLAGGCWSNGSYCGSRCRYSYAVRLGVDASFGGRGSSRVIRGH